MTDSDGVEVGYVNDVDEKFLKIGEGSLGQIKIGRKFISMVTDRVVLNGPAATIFSGLNVIDSDGEFVGVVRDTVESGEVLDSVILEDEEGNMLVAVMEDILAIDEWVELRISGGDLHEKQ